MSFLSGLTAMCSLPRGHKVAVEEAFSPAGSHCWFEVFEVSSSAAPSN